MQYINKTKEDQKVESMKKTQNLANYRNEKYENPNRRYKSKSH